MKIVRLTQQEFRKWRANVPCVVGDDGLPVREVTVEEGAVFRELDKQALAAKRSVGALLDEETENERRLDVTYAISPRSGTHIITRMVDGKKVIPGHDAMMAALAVVHGDRFQVRMPGGKFPLKTARGQTAATTSVASAMAGVPSPESCQCSAYAGRQRAGTPEGGVTGRHHKVCQYNDRAPAEERALDSGVVLSAVGPTVGVPGATPSKPEIAGAPTPAPTLQQRVRFLPSTAPVQAEPAPGSVARAPAAVPGFMQPKPVIETTAAVPVPAQVPVAPVVAPPAAPPSPEACPNVCYKWFGHPTGKPDQHHGTCAHREAWEDLQKGADARVLVDLETRAILRAATDEEIAEASKNLWICKVDDRTYGVLLKSDVERAGSPAAAAPPAAPLDSPAPAPAE